MSTRPSFVVGAILVLTASVACAGEMDMRAIQEMLRQRQMSEPKRTAPNPAIEAMDGITAILHTTAGDITVDFRPYAAPNTVRSFIKLAASGFYDGQRFYCVFKDKMILAGDPTATGKGDNGKTLPAEGSGSHRAGTLAMDRATPDPKSGKKVSSGSRFLINLTDQSHLDGDYTVFAEITNGLDVARRIGACRTSANDGRPAPLEDLVIESIVIHKKTEEDAKASK
ncbi:peptidylprolyl isomerase [bacterium]|nr:peptidylprolyl isomerase [bacterium]